METNARSDDSGKKYWVLEHKVEFCRDRAPAVCQALTDLAMHNGYSARYVPRAQGDTSLCSYHWPVPFRGLRFGLEVAFFAVITPSRRGRLKGYVWPGQDWPESQEIILTEGERREVKDFAEAILGKLDAWLRGEGPKQHALRFIQGPFFTFSGAGGEECRIFRTRVKDGSWVTPYSICTRGFAESEAHDRTAEKSAWLRALVQVCTDNPTLGFETEHETELVHGDLPSEEMIAKLLDNAPPLQREAAINGNDMTQLFPGIAHVAGAGPLQEGPKLARALLAYSDGVELLNDRVALGGIAFCASLASFVQSKSCAGTPKCDVCARAVQHQEKGEIEHIVDFLQEEVFEKPDWPRNKSRDGLIRFYREQRSAFVHQARAALGRSSHGAPAHPLGPTATATVHPALQFQEDLTLARALARIAILAKLAPLHAAFEELCRSVRDGFRVPLIARTDKVRTFDDKWRHIPICIFVPTGLFEPVE